MSESEQPTRILVVEDSPTQSAVLRHILTRAKYHVSAAGSAKEALEMLQRERPTLVISDIVMPGMDGYELCKRIKTHDDTRHVPVILLTQLADPRDIIKGLECGADNFITKPYEEEFLLSRIEYILINRRLRQHAASGMAVEIFFGGEKYLITADRLQILHLLLTTYETTVHKNEELQAAREAVQAMNRKIELLHEIALNLSQCDSEDAVCRQAVEAAPRLVALRSCAISMRENGAFALRAHWGELPARTETQGAIAPRVAEQTLAAGRLQCFGPDDAAPDSEESRPAFARGCSLPIGRAGVFQAVAETADAFGRDELRLLELLLRHTEGEARRIRYENELKRLALRDPLTGVYNRNYLALFLDRERKRAKRYNHTLSFLAVDVDQFKRINDRFGHQKGDEILREVARLLQTQARSSDVVFRQGGDEFLVAMPETELTDAEALRNRILAEVDRRNNHAADRGESAVTLSIGAAHWDPQSAHTIEDALALADERMYEHKRQRGAASR